MQSSDDGNGKAHAVIGQRSLRPNLLPHTVVGAILGATLGF